MQAKDLKKLKIVITGSAGQLGQAIQEESQHFTTLECTFLSKEALDITSPSSISETINTYQPDIIINTAAYTAVDAAEENVAQAYLINTQAVTLLAKACKSNNLGLIHISTDYIFDGTKVGGYLENDKTNPQSVYGASKREGELSILDLELPVYAIVRTSWVYSNYKSNFVKTMLKLAHKHREISVVKDQYGSPTYANDLAQAILEICTELSKENSGIYNYANKGRISWFDFAKNIFKIKEIGIKVYPIETKEFPTKATRPLNSELITDKISKTFDVNIPDWKVSLQKMLSRE